MVSIDLWASHSTKIKVNPAPTGSMTGLFWKWQNACLLLTKMPFQQEKKIRNSKVYSWWYPFISTSVAVCLFFIHSACLVAVLKSVSCLKIKLEYQIFHLSCGTLGISVCSTAALWSKILEGLKSCYLSCILTNKYLFCSGILCEGNSTLKHTKR